MLSLIKRKISNKTKNAIVECHILFKCEVHILEDIALIESVQRRALKMIEGFYIIAYKERLQKAGLTILIDRRVGGVLIQVYKIITSIGNFSYKRFFKLSNSC
jgi:hypothetical protein